MSISPDVLDPAPTGRLAGPSAPDGPAGFQWPCELPEGAGDGRYHRACAAGTAPGGLRMKTETLTGRADRENVQHIVSIQLPGNRALSASVSNMVGVDEQAVAAQPEPPHASAAGQPKAVAYGSPSGSGPDGRDNQELSIA